MNSGSAASFATLCHHMVFQVHVSEFSTISGGGGVCQGHLEAQYARSLCDVLIVQTGGASELYALMVKEIKSAGGPKTIMNPETFRSTGFCLNQYQTCKPIQIQTRMRQ